jgi:protein-L-isoaspartate(D-aspartate) O-methyltransferase
VSDVAALQQALVDTLSHRGHIRSPRVEAAFRAVPRHLFLPGAPVEQVYRDQVIVTKTIDGEAVSSSSQPEIMAVMLEQLELRPGHRVLEVGAGTGYNAALMAHIVGEGGEVVTLDIDADLVDAARDHLATAGLGRVRVVLGDGGGGHPDGAPYDRIILTVGAWDLAPAWREQLRRDGRLVLPLVIGGSQKSVAFARDGDRLESVSVKECLFMPLRGAFAGPPSRVGLGAPPGLNLYVQNPARVDPGAAHALLTGPGGDLPTGVRATGREVYGGLVLWMSLREPGFCWLEAVGPYADSHAVPHLFALAGKYRSAAGVFEGDSAGFFTRPPGDPAPVEVETQPRPFELVVRSFGDGGGLARRLLAHAQAWDGAGRPGTDGLRIRALPIEVGYTPGAREQVVMKRWTRLVLDWPAQAGEPTSAPSQVSR